MINRILPHMLSLFLPQRNASMSDRSPSSDFWYSAVGRQTKSGIQVTDEEALRYSAVWACTRILSSTGGRLPLNLYRRSSNRGKAIVKTDPRDRLVFRRPNAHMTPSLFKSQGLIRQINCGNSYSEIQRNFMGEPVAFHPIHNSRVKPVIDDKTDELSYEIKNNDGSKIYIDSANMLHVPSMMTHNGIVGLGVLDYARETIGLGLATEQSGASVFGNGALPRVVVESPKKWSPESRANFRKEWKEIYGGVDGDKAGILDEGAKLHVLGVNHEQLQFLSTRQHNVEELARWYGVPPHKIQHLLRSTNNNIEHQSIEFMTDSVMPWLVIWEEELDRKLLTEEEQQDMFFAFDATQYLRGDTAARSAYWQTMVNSGIACRNEARVEEDLNPVEGGDVFLVQGAMVAVGPDGVPMAGAFAATPKEPADDDDTVDDDTVDDNTDEDDTEDREQALASAARSMLEGCLSRMLHKEATAARRAANKPREFLGWLDEFYAKHGQQLDESLTHIGTACATMGYSIDGLSGDYVRESSGVLLELAGESTADSLPGAVDALMTKWESSRVAGIVSEVFERKACAV
jgi:HK97 family phage portal protein